LLNKQKRGAIFVKEEGFWLIRFGKNGNFVFSAKVDGFKHLEIKNATGVLKIGGKHYASWEEILNFVKKEYKVSLKNFVPTTRYEGLFQASK